MSKFLDHILVNNNSIIKLKQEDLCKEHSFPEKICKECKLSLINKLNIHKDIKQYLGNLIPDITTFSLDVSEYDEQIGSRFRNFRTYLSLAKNENSRFHLGNIILYFNECSEEFIFGFLSFLASSYSVNNNKYEEKYYEKIQDEGWHNFRLKYVDNGKIIVSYFKDDYFMAYLTINPEEFKEGWKVASNIGEVIKYIILYNEEGTMFYEKYLSFEEIKECFYKNDFN